MKIKDIKAIEILDSRGNPTIKTFVFLDDESTASSSIPSGASTGSGEAFELRDNDKKRYFGKGVLKAVDNVNKIIRKKLIGLKADNPDKIDQLLIDLDGTSNKSHLGANAILSVSQALIKALALSSKKPLWQFINKYYFSDIKPDFPKLMLNVINGGRHANWNFDIQEFIIIPKKEKPTEAIKIAAEIYQSIKKNLKEKNLSTLIGDEGGFSPSLKSNEEVFKFIINSAEKIGYQNGVDYNLAIDAAASEFYQNKKYLLKKENKKITGDQLINYYQKLKTKYKIISFEDPFAENDWENFQKFTKQNKDIIVIGDDIYTTNPQLIKKGIDKKTTNAVLIKPNQIGTILETVEAIKLAKKNSWKVVISHRSGETDDFFIADLAYSCNADFIKTGAPARSERLAKYNRLIEIEKLNS